MGQRLGVASATIGKALHAANGASDAAGVLHDSAGAGVCVPPRSQRSPHRGSLSPSALVNIVKLLLLGSISVGRQRLSMSSGPAAYIAVAYGNSRPRRTTDCEMFGERHDRGGL